MKFVVSLDHQRFFNEYGFIEFEELVTPEKLKEINRALDTVLVKRTGAKLSALKDLPPAELFPYARNLWMDSEGIKKFDCQGRLTEIVLSLSKKNELILGYDQLLIPEQPLANPYYPAAFPEALPLADVSSAQDIVCAMVVCLQGGGEGSFGIFPAKEGNVTFIRAQTPVDFSVLEQNQDKRFLLVAFADPKSVYLYREKDPNTHFNKQKGYVFGDRLFNKGHPAIRVR
jgi:hypothetical protein